MGIYSKPIFFAILSIIVIAIGTLVTTIIPLFMPSTQPVSDYIKPYTVIELEGRDIYIREGCNNCHTQTVRPLRTEVARYGEYSKPEEFAYDRPFLWGSRRTGPDLNRTGGKYPDSWHYQHMNNPQSMFRKSNMPAYAWLAERKLNTNYLYKKASILSLGYTQQDVDNQIAALKANVTAEDYPSKTIRDQVTPSSLRAELTEMDAIVAYLQKLGRDVKDLEKKESVKVAEAALSADEKNPYFGEKNAINEGKNIYVQSCAVCHGADAKGGIGPNLADADWVYGDSDSDVFHSISAGRENGMPEFASSLGKDKIWKVVTFIRTLEKN